MEARDEEGTRAPERVQGRTHAGRSRPYGAPVQRVERVTVSDDVDKEIQEFHEDVLDSLFDFIDGGGDVGDIDNIFDIRAQHIQEWDDLKEVIPSILVSSAGGFLPFEMRGWVCSLPFYIRSEWGEAELRIAADEGDIFRGPLLWTSTTTTPEEMDRPQLISVISSLFSKLEVAPFLWGFTGRKVEFVDAPDSEDKLPIATSEEDIYYAWGKTPEGAWKQLRAPNLYLLDDLSFWENIKRLEDIQPDPVVVDDRVIPDAPDWFNQLG